MENTISYIDNRANSNTPLTLGQEYLDLHDNMIRDPYIGRFVLRMKSGSLFVNLPASPAPGYLMDSFVVLTPVYLVNPNNDFNRKDPTTEMV